MLVAYPLALPFLVCNTPQHINLKLEMKEFYRVLQIEDEEIAAIGFRAAILNALAAHDLPENKLGIMRVENESEATELLDEIEFRPDMIVADLTSEKRNITSLENKLRTLPHRPPLIVLSGYDYTKRPLGSLVEASFNKGGDMDKAAEYIVTKIKELDRLS